MRILHTADWHLGKMLEGRSRLPEQERFIDELVTIVDEQKIDVVLMAGDVFDTFNPPALAEKLFYEALARVSDHGRRPIVVIAGNHDHPGRLGATSSIAQWHSITLLGLPNDRVQQIYVPSCDETLIVAALPYPSESRLNELLVRSCDEEVLRAHYDERVRTIFAKMNESFRDDTVNIAMSHLYVTGGATCDSERPIELGGAYTVSPASFPARAQYVALGHLHRPQNVKHAAMPARYAGSPLAYSFSESGYSKSVTIVDVHPQGVPIIEEIPLTSGRPLVRWKAAGIDEVYRWLDEERDREAWIDVEIDVEQSLTMEEIQKLRQACSRFVTIRPNYKRNESETAIETRANVPIETLFERFYERQTGGGKPSRELVQLFLQLVAEEGEDEADSLDDCGIA